MRRLLCGRRRRRRRSASIQIGAAKRTATVQRLHRQVRGRAHRHELRRDHGRRSGDRGRQSADRRVAVDPRQEERHHAGVGLCRRQEADRRVRRRGDATTPRCCRPKSAAASRTPSSGSPRSTAASCCPAPRRTAPTARQGGDDRQAVRPGRHQLGGGAAAAAGHAGGALHRGHPPGRPRTRRAVEPCSASSSIANIGNRTPTGQLPVTNADSQRSATAWLPTQPRRHVRRPERPAERADDLADRGGRRAVGHRAVRLHGRQA